MSQYIIHGVQEVQWALPKEQKRSNAYIIHNDKPALN